MHLGCLLFLAPVLLACASPVEGSTSSAAPDKKASPDPSAADICEHIMRVVERELGESATTPSEQEISDYLSGCAKRLVLEQQKLGEEEFLRQARCVMAAQAMTEMEKCEDPAPQAP